MEISFVETSIAFTFTESAASYTSVYHNGTRTVKINSWFEASAMFPRLSAAVLLTMGVSSSQSFSKNGRIAFFSAALN